MPAAANMFLRGDIQVSTITLPRQLPFNYLIQFLTENNGGLWNLNKAHSLSFTNYSTHVRTVVDVTHAYYNSGGFGLRNPNESSTHELYWLQRLPPYEFSPKLTHQYVLIKSQKTKGFIGYPEQQVYPLKDGVQLEIGETQENWANVLITWMKSSDDGEHWLLTATGYSENSGMVWKDEKKNSVGRNWGDGPPLVEPVPLRLAMPFQKSSKPGLVYPLNERGQRMEGQSIEMKRAGNNDILRLDKTQTSLWYEIVMPNKP